MLVGESQPARVVVAAAKPLRHDRRQATADGEGPDDAVERCDGAKQPASAGARDETQRIIRRGSPENAPTLA